MKRTLLVALTLFLAHFVAAQNTPVTQFNQDFITSTQCVSVPTGGLQTGSFGVTGGWTGTLTASGVVGQATAVTLLNATANGSYMLNVAGYTKLQVCGNTVATGAAFVQVYSQNSMISGSFAGAPNMVTVGGSAAAFQGPDICQAIANALNGTLSSGQKWGGIFNASGFTGVQVCPPNSLNNLNAALQTTTGATAIILGSPLFWYVPQQISQAATVGSPAVGAVNITPYDDIGGNNPASVSDNQTTHVIFCPPAGVQGCTPPQALEWPITSTVASSSGASINDRAYMQINSANMTLVGGQPVTIDAGGATTTANNIAGSFTVCQQTSQTASSGFALVSGNTYKFTVTSTAGLTAGASLVTLSGFTNITSQTVTVISDGNFDATHFDALVTGSVGATSAGTVQTGNLNIQNDAKCPANPTPSVVYVPIENGILATSITNAGTGGTCNNIVPTWGAGCIINPELHITCSGAGGSQVANAAFIKHAGKCQSTPTISGFTDTLGGTVPVGLAISVFTAQSASGSQASGNCASNCGIIHGEIPLFEIVDNGGTNQNAPMGGRVHDLVIDLRQNADASCYRDLGGNEHTRIWNINCTGYVNRAVSRWSKQTNSGDDIYSFRAVVGKLPNQAVPPASSGTGTVAGTTLTTTAGSGFFFGLNAAGTPSCNYAVNTPIYLTTGGVTTANSINTCTGSAPVTFSNGSAIITGIGTGQGMYAGLPIHFATTGSLPTGFTAGTVYFISSTNLAANTISVSATNGGSVITAGSAGSGTQTAMAGITATLGTAPGNGTYTYYVPGCDLGTEGFYAAGGFGHGSGDVTVDDSACTATYDYPYINSNAGTAVQHLPNCGIRAETHYFGTTIHDEHTERTAMNICAGLGAPVYGLAMNGSDYGEPNGITNITGQFQNYHPTNIHIFNDYFSNSLGNTATQQYTVTNAPTSFNSYYSLVDDNPVGPGFTAGPADPFNLSQYSVEWSAIQSSGSNTVCVNVNSTVPGYGNWSTCPQAGYALSAQSQTLSADTAGITTITPAGANQTFVLKGFSPNQTYRIHCSGTTTQATAGTGIAIAGVATAPVTSLSWNLHAMVSTSATATAGGSSGVVTNSGTATQVYLGAAGTLTTELPWTVDGYLTVGANAPTSFIVGFYSTNASNAVVVKQGSYCGIVP